MPGRSTRHQPSSLLLGLPQDLRIEIATHVGATSERPLADLRSLRGTCSTMQRVCGHGDIGWRLSIEGIQSIPCYAERSLETGGLFTLRNQSLLHRRRDTMISGAPLRVGTMRWPLYKPSCSTETMAVPLPTTTRRGT
jgi:hypothetical protein